MKRSRIALMSLLAFALIGASAAQAVSVPTPKTGSWTTTGVSGGFTLKKGKGNQSDKIFVSNFSLSSELNTEACENTSSVAKVLGKFPLKYVTLNGYSFWGAGKASGYEFLEVPAKVSFNGKTVNGRFKLAFTHSAKRAAEGHIEFGSCELAIVSAQHK